MTSLLPDRIETSRLLLRQPVLADALRLFEAYTQDAGAARFMVWRPHSEVSQTEAFVERCNRDWVSGLRRPYLASFLESTTHPIGMVEARQLGHTIDIGYVLARRYWGHGLMPEAVAALAEIALADTRVFRIQATCDTDNTASARTLEKLASSGKNVLNDSRCTRISARSRDHASCMRSADSR